jgi:hypothetical protein
MSHAAKEATATVFHVAFRALPKETRDQFLALLLRDEDLRDHIEGALLWEERKNEPRIPFDEVLKKSRARAR